MLKKIFKTLLFFVLGMAGGIFSGQFVLPALNQNLASAGYSFLQSPVYLTEKREITIEENRALQNSIEKVRKSVVGIKIKNGASVSGSGLILTRDGLMVALSTVVPQDKKFTFYADGKFYDYQILKRDFQNNLVLIKLEGSGFNTVGFADLKSLRIGERVFLLGVSDLADEAKISVNEGILSFLDSESVQTNIIEKKLLQGSLIFNINGNAVGMNYFKNQNINVIPIFKIREFSGI